MEVASEFLGAPLKMEPTLSNQVFKPQFCYPDKIADSVCGKLSSLQNIA